MSGVALALPFEFERGEWLWLCALAPVMVAASLGSLRGLDRARRVAVPLARSVVIILIAVCLAGAQRVRRNHDLTVMFLMDRSYSVREREEFQERYILEAARDVPPRDRVGMIDFARNAHVQQLPMTGGYFVPPGRLPPMPDADRTDVASALRLAMAMFPHDTAKRIVLISDGNDNMGDLLAEARRAGADGIPIDVVPVRYHHRNEVYFDRIIAPAHAEPGEQVPLRMVLNSQKAVSGTIALYVNGAPLELPEDSARVRLAPGNNTFFMTFPAATAGAQTYEGVFRPDDDSLDTIALNNSASAFTFVSGASTALLLTSNPAHDGPLAEALLKENVRVEMRDVSTVGAFDIINMMNYSAIILANVPAAAFTDRQQRALAVYVRDMGSGLIMLGGDDSFGAGGWIGSPVEEVMPVSFEIKHKRVIPRGALVLIMHSCEIPRGNFWGKEMAKKSVDTISSQDYVGVLAYTYSPGGENWEIPLDLNNNKPAIKARIDGMQIGDMPDFGTTMTMAYEELTAGRGRDAAQKHVIILSDGDAQAPPSELLDLYVKAKITVSTIGIGWGAHVMVSTLSDIAQKTSGTFYTAQRASQLPQIFTKESKVTQRPLIVDEPFQPQLRHIQSDLLAGIDPHRDALPPLGGLVLTSPKQSPNVLIPAVRMTDDGEDPVLAHWQCELGKAVAFTSGYWPVWGQRWTQWPKFAKFWAQVVRWTMRQDTPANFDTYTKIDGNRARIVVDALDKDAGYLNNLRLKAKMTGPEGKASELKFVQTGPGKYEAEFDAERSGQHLTNVHVYEGSRPLGTIRTGISVPFSPEYRDLTPNEAMLRQVADISGGRWLDAGPVEDDVFSHDLPPTVSRRGVWDWILAWLLLPAFLIDVAVRRLASWLAVSVVVELILAVVLLFGFGAAYGPWWHKLSTLIFVEVVGWAIRFRYIPVLFAYLTHGVTVLSKTGERSAVSLERLKSARERLRGERLRPDADEPGGAIPGDPAARRFTLSDDAGVSDAADDLQEALGGPPVGEGPGEVRRPPRRGPRDQEETMSRLLRAKKRRRRDTDEK